MAHTPARERQFQKLHAALENRKYRNCSCSRLVYKLVAKEIFKNILEVSMVAHVSIWTLRQEDGEFKSSLGYIIRPDPSSQF